MSNQALTEENVQGNKVSIFPVVGTSSSIKEYSPISIEELLHIGFQVLRLNSDMRRQAQMLVGFEPSVLHEHLQGGL